MPLRFAPMIAIRRNSSNKQNSQYNLPVSMNRMDYDVVLSPSYFWDCVTLSKDCPFLSNVDPKLYYFGVGLLVLYGAFLLVILADLKFYWSLDNFQRQIDYYINLVRKKVRHVQMDQRRLVSTQERTEKLLKKSEECKRMVTALRGALHDDDTRYLSLLTNTEDPNTSSTQGELWSEDRSVIDF
ncbi:hypothetical protein ABMA28_001042 [Loxostege sticticalis]|uniref:Uncharacterized protein n=2 Tax=Loxostege sticticalis TaxID=481309 RepID=A0ABD0T4E6_LOXSC